MSDRNLILRVFFGVFSYIFFIIFIVIFITNLLNPTGEGMFAGKLIDVSYGGAFFDSCEITQQVGSNKDHASTLDKNMCNELTKVIGKEITIKYKMKKFSLKTDTNFIIENFK